jgi:hypothetical protein
MPFFTKLFHFTSNVGKGHSNKCIFRATYWNSIVCKAYYVTCVTPENNWLPPKITSHCYQNWNVAYAYSKYIFIWRPDITNVMNVIIEANNCCNRETIGIIKFALVSFWQQCLTVCFNVKYFHLTLQHALSSTIITLEPRHFCKSV